jgi:hypothetical protein
MYLMRILPFLIATAAAPPEFPKAEPHEHRRCQRAFQGGRRKPRCGPRARRHK